MKRGLIALFVFSVLMLSVVGVSAEGIQQGALVLKPAPCIGEWSYSPWSECKDGVKTRIGFYLDNCGKSNTKTETATCTETASADKVDEGSVINPMSKGDTLLIKNPEGQSKVTETGFSKGFNWLIGSFKAIAKKWGKKTEVRTPAAVAATRGGALGTQTKISTVDTSGEEIPSTTTENKGLLASLWGKLIGTA